MKNYVIYSITSPSNKIYIGQTCNFNKRLYFYKNIKNNSKQKIISNSIIKYGFNNHKIEILFNNLSKLEANNIEISLIKYYKKLKISLNITNGGEGTIGTGIPVIVLDKNNKFLYSFDSISECCLFLKIISVNEVSRSFKKTFFVKGYFIIPKILYDPNKKYEHFGKKYSGRKAIPVEGYDLNYNKLYEFPTALDASRAMNVAYSSIMECINNKWFSLKDIIWVKKGINPKNRKIINHKN